MLGSFGVGKTSLVAQFVHTIFSDQDHKTVGVKIDKKVLSVGGRDLTLMLWDMAGEKTAAPIKLNQIRDAAGYLLVIDGCRRKTLDVAVSIHERVENEIGPCAFILLSNKADLRSSWEVPDRSARGSVRSDLLSSDETCFCLAAVSSCRALATLSENPLALAAVGAVPDNLRTFRQRCR